MKYNFAMQELHSLLFMLGSLTCYLYMCRDRRHMAVFRNGSDPQFVFGVGSAECRCTPKDFEPRGCTLSIIQVH